MTTKTLLHLGSRGIGHIIMPMIVAVGFAVAGVFYIVASHAQTPSTVYVTSGPSGTVTSSTARFTFLVKPADSAVICKLDAKPFAACASSVTYGGLASGTHTAYIRARLGNTVTRTWTVGTTPPPDSRPGSAPKITSGPPATTKESTATFTFESTDGGTISCVLNGFRVTPCKSPQTFYNLPDADWFFVVSTSKIPPGTIDTNPYSTQYKWNITGGNGNPHCPDLTHCTPPNPPPGSAPKITSGPPATTKESTATFTFESTDGGTISCVLNGFRVTPCKSPQTFYNLPDADWFFVVSTSKIPPGTIDTNPYSTQYKWNITGGNGNPHCPDLTHCTPRGG